MNSRPRQISHASVRNEVSGTGPQFYDILKHKHVCHGFFTSRMRAVNVPVSKLLNEKSISCGIWQG